MSWKAVAQTSIWLGKGKATCIEMYGAKSQRLTYQIEISKISGIDLTMRCVVSKRLNAMLNVEPNESFKELYSYICGRSYMYISIIERGHII